MTSADIIKLFTVVGVLVISPFLMPSNRQGSLKKLRYLISSVVMMSFFAFLLLRMIS